jgi:nucleoside-diphosphate-sugar epimerase
MERRVPGIERVQALTGYSPQVTLDEALARTRDWFLESGRLTSPAALTQAATY